MEDAKITPPIEPEITLELHSSLWGRKLMIRNRVPENILELFELRGPEHIIGHKAALWSRSSGRAIRGHAIQPQRDLRA
jgi:hypothetical protein